MAKKSQRRGRKGARKTHRRGRRQQLRRGGYLLQGADIKESLYGSSASQQSLAQGDDFASYHQAQHGGVAPIGQAFDVMTDQQMLSSSMSAGQLKAIADVRPLRDDQPPPLDPTIASPSATVGTSASCGPQLGGRRRRRRTSKKSKKSKKSKGAKKSKKSNRRRRQGGGSLGYAPVNSPGLLLDSAAAYNNAGLNPEYYKGSSTEQFAANMRDNA